jgi:hypothetical protein
VSGHPLVLRSFEQFKVTSVQTSWQHVQTLFNVREDSALLRKQGVGRQLAPVRMPRQHRPDAEILIMEIACIHSASIQMRSVSILCWLHSGRKKNTLCNGRYLNMIIVLFRIFKLYGHCLFQAICLITSFVK